MNLTDKNIEKIIEENTEQEEILDENSGPCWEIKVDKKRKKLLFLLDGTEMYCSALKNFADLSLNKILYLLDLFKKDDHETLKKEAKIK